MSFEKVFKRNQQIGETLKSMRHPDDHSLLTALGKPYRELLAAQERLLNAAENMAESIKRMGDSSRAI